MTSICFVYQPTYYSLWMWGIYIQALLFKKEVLPIYLTKHPGPVITNDMTASLVATAWPSAFTPNDIMGGFRKTGVFPINPGVIDDKMLSPSEAFQQQKPMTEKEISPPQAFQQQNSMPEQEASASAQPQMVPCSHQIM